jgi:hypothetical protein
MLLRRHVASEQAVRELVLRDLPPLPSAGSDVSLMLTHSPEEDPIQLRESTLQLANGTRFSKDKYKYK